MLSVDLCDSSYRAGSANLGFSYVDSPNHDEQLRNVVTYPFHQDRVRIKFSKPDVGSMNNGPVVYWMERDQRVQDNWAVIYAQKYALQAKVPFKIIYCLDDGYTLRRQKDFILRGLVEVEQECKTLNIDFIVLWGVCHDALSSFCILNNIGIVVTDFTPLKPSTERKKNFIQKLGVLNHQCTVYEIDSHNIIPVWAASNRVERSAAAMLTAIQSKIDDFCTEFPLVKTHPYGDISGSTYLTDETVTLIVEDVCVPGGPAILKLIIPGKTAASRIFEDFLLHKLSAYSDFSSKTYQEKAKKFISSISPWRHFGQISCQRMAVEVARILGNPYSAGFLHSLVIRKELAENFCYYETNYDSLSAAAPWALETLQRHTEDKREWVYMYEEFRSASTHDELWNAGQSQLVLKGRMHGYIRMYWGKKILEWTNTLEDALNIAVKLNDTYSIDGHDPSGYAGIMWCIAGVHDRPWKNRPIYGRIRYMSDVGCTRRFDTEKYINRFKVSTTTMSRYL